MGNDYKPLRVDAHQHFWKYSEAEFGWIDDSMAVIRRDFLPDDLKPFLDVSGVSATVAVQACQTVAETDWLLQLADNNSWIAGVVGWAPLISSSVGQTLERLAAHPKLKGIRHVLQAEPSEYMLRDDFNQGVAMLRKFNLTYDVLIHQHQLPAAIEFVDRHPYHTMILDHVAKPLIKAGELEPWRELIRELARRPHVSCKLSGMVTEADFSAWTVDGLRPYVETVLEAFGPSRLLFGSDWPVCAVACHYEKWVSIVRQFVSALSDEEQAKILGGNAIQGYNLNFADDSNEVHSA
ncbi:amidohydrolase family protein [Acidicapsa dinghuensis]|uniref:Amidohydrolase family protein n=1 Tax=Acidicapsa dinghuensis TaxID=2218256 RepID=A0ABW1EFA8_9BACT|nr:amidohydrolase family protein [Acidicapsa dinghuensis]